MSIPGYNFWCTMSEAYKAELWPYVKWHGGQQFDENGDPIPEPVPTAFPTIATISQGTVDLFNEIHDADAVERLFKSWDAAGRTYKNWSCYANKPTGVPQIRADLDALIAADPNDFSISGAWSCADGQEVGQPVWYPIPPQIVNFMPDIMTDPGDPEADPVVPPTYVPATQPTDVNLLAGQAPRSFGSFTG
jgi:hypothetical protein